MSTDELLEKLKAYGFKDEHGHSLENCVEFQGLSEWARCGESAHRDFLDEIGKTEEQWQAGVAVHRESRKVG